MFPELNIYIFIYILYIYACKIYLYIYLYICISYKLIEKVTKCELSMIITLKGGGGEAA